MIRFLCFTHRNFFCCRYSMTVMGIASRLLLGCVDSGSQCRVGKFCCVALDKGLWCMINPSYPEIYASRLFQIILRSSSESIVVVFEDVVSRNVIVVHRLALDTSICTLWW